MGDMSLLDKLWERVEKEVKDNNERGYMAPARFGTDKRLAATVIASHHLHNDPANEGSLRLRIDAQPWDSVTPPKGALVLIVWEDVAVEHKLGDVEGCYMPPEWDIIRLPMGSWGIRQNGEPYLYGVKNCPWCGWKLGELPIEENTP